MAQDEFDEFEDDEIVERPRDVKIDEAKSFLMQELFAKNPEQVFYQRQVEVLFERKYFHWITAKALNELAAERRIRAATRSHPSIRIRFYWSVSNRYWRRRANAIGKLVFRFSESSFTRGIG
jgi:hypothetical protein